MFRVYGLGLSSSFDRLRRCFGGFVVLQGSAGLPSVLGMLVDPTTYCVEGWAL